jgi:hypothetical protein
MDIFEIIKSIFSKDYSFTSNINLQISAGYLKKAKNKEICDEQRYNLNCVRQKR